MAIKNNFSSIITSIKDFNTNQKMLQNNNKIEIIYK